MDSAAAIQIQGADRLSMIAVSATVPGVLAVLSPTEPACAKDPAYFNSVLPSIT